MGGTVESTPGSAYAVKVIQSGGFDSTGACTSMMGGGTPFAPSLTRSTSDPFRWLVRSSDELEARDEEPNENFLVGGAGGLRLLELMGVCDREPGTGVRDEPERLDAADPGRSGSEPFE